MTATKISDPAQEIATLVRENWEERGSPILLSALGMKLSENTKEAMDAEKLTLRRYVAANLENLVRFVTMPKFGGGFAPIVETEAFTDEQLEQIYIDQKPEAAPRFDREVWRAFRERIAPDKVRHISIDGQLSFHDEDGDTGPAPGEYILTEKDQPNFKNNFATDAEVVEAIRAWAGRVGVNEQSLTFTKKERPANIPTKRDESKRKSKGLFDLLTQDELARIAIPGDIVASLLERLRNA